MTAAPAPHSQPGNALVAWVATHPDRGPQLGLIAKTEQGATSRLMMTGVAGNHGWSVIPLYAALPLPEDTGGRDKTHDWTPEQFWEYAEGLTNAFTRGQLRTTMAERGLRLASMVSSTHLGGGND